MNPNIAIYEHSQKVLRGKEFTSYGYFPFRISQTKVQMMRIEQKDCFKFFVKTPIKFNLVLPVLICESIHVSIHTAMTYDFMQIYNDHY